MEDENYAYLRVYKTNEPIQQFQSLPVKSKQRIPTDIFCTYFSSIFAIAMFLIAIFNFNLEALQKMTYPTDQQGRHCTLDNSNYNYLYFTSSNDPMKRLCVAQCPQGNEEKLECLPTENLSCSKNSNPDFEVIIYPSEPSQTSLGLFCHSKDSAFNRKLLDNAGLGEMYSFVTAYKSIGVTLLSAFGFGILGVFFFSLFPAMMTELTILIGGITSILTAIFLITSHSQLLSIYKTLVILFALMIGLIGILLIWAFFFKQKDINLSIIYLKQASKCFWEFPSLATFSFIFIVFFIGLVILCGFQILAYWSNSQMILHNNQVYYRPTGTFATIMTVLCSIQFLWGLCFLKQAFNMILSGTTVSWCFRGQHSIPFALGNLFKYHWGSVAGGAFILNLLYPFDIVYDQLKPSDHSHGAYRSFCCCCQKILDLARAQAMILINIAGMPYCNASRWCQKIQFHYELMEGSQSSNRFVRIGAHVSLSFFSTLIGYLYMKSSDNVSQIGLILGFVLSVFILTFFICLIKDMAETIGFYQMLKGYYNKGNEQIAKKLFGEGYQVFPTEN